MSWPTFGAAAAAVSAVSAAGGGGGGMRLQWRRQRSRLISQNSPHTLIHNTPFSRIFVRLDFFVNPNSVDRCHESCCVDCPRVCVCVWVCVDVLFV